MKLKIAVLAGDGIGPEIMEQGVAVLSAVAKKFGHEVSYKEALCGAHAIDEVGDPFPEETFRVCEEADAVLFASVGDPKFDNNPTAKVRPEQGLLAMRKKLGLYANIRPVETFDCLIHKSPLKDSLVKGADFICIRELTGGMYFGKKQEPVVREDGVEEAYDTNYYSRPEVERILKVGYQYARQRRVPVRPSAANCAQGSRTSSQDGCWQRGPTSCAWQGVPAQDAPLQQDYCQISGHRPMQKAPHQPPYTSDKFLRGTGRPPHQWRAHHTMPL